MVTNTFYMTTEKIPAKTLLIIREHGQPADFFDYGKNYLPQICLGITIIVLGTILFVLCRKLKKQRCKEGKKING